NQLAGNSIETFVENQLDVTYKFETGSLRHTLVSGVEVGRETSAPTRYTAFAGVPTTSELDPNESQSLVGNPTAQSQTRVNSTTGGLYTLDTMSIGRSWDIIGGVRWDYFGTNYKQNNYTYDAQQNTVPGAVSAFHRVDRMTSYRGALVYKPTADG